MEETKPIVQVLKDTDMIIIPESKPNLPAIGKEADQVIDKPLKVKEAVAEKTNQVVVEIEASNASDSLIIPMKRDISESDSDEDEDFEAV